MLGGHSLWILVIDTRGINVWCAAGKKTFSTEEIVYQVNRCNLSDIVNHRKLIIPQLGAPGVSASRLKKGCGFGGVFGPVRATDIPRFLSGETDENMRSVTFTLKERVVLIPVELVLFWKNLLYILLTAALLACTAFVIGTKTAAAATAAFYFSLTLLGIGSGAVLFPLFLPLLPFTQFWIKGALVGSIISLLFLLTQTTYSLSTLAAGFLWCTTLSSFMAMNFTGSTPYTSLSGVEKEVKTAIPYLLSGAIISFLTAFVSLFLSR